jgi:hypothetical protein
MGCVGSRTKPESLLVSSGEPTRYVRIFVSCGRDRYYLGDELGPLSAIEIEERLKRLGFHVQYDDPQNCQIHLILLTGIYYDALVTGNEIEQLEPHKGIVWDLDGDMCKHKMKDSKFKGWRRKQAAWMVGRVSDERLAANITLKLNLQMIFN